MSEPLITLDNIGVTYPNGHTALTDVSVTLSSGTICGLIGVNGSGKSTLFKSMMGFIKPTTGSVSIKGIDVRKALRKNIVSYVPQTEEVDWNFPVLVEDVVMMGRYAHMGFLRIPSQHDKDAVDDALNRVNLFDLKKRQIGELSGGQKKRVFVARALAQGGQIILLDEPFTGVDVKTEESLIALFRTLSKEGRLIVVSTHNLGSVPSFCDDVMLIKNTLLAYGPVQTTFTEDNLTKAFGGMLRHQHIVAKDIHTDKDPRSVTVLTDDERPLVLYGDPDHQNIVPPETE
jgi:manganese/iron transport system ATP-binding protein